MITPQPIANGLYVGAVYALVAMSFTVIYGTTRFFHIAHGAVYTTGAYLAYLLADHYRLTLGISVAVAAILACLFGMLIEVAAYRQLRRRHAAPLVLLLGSLGVYIAIQNAISLLFGDDTKSLRTAVVREGLDVLGARVTATQCVTVGASLLLFAAVGIARNRTQFGRASKAVACDAELSTARGVDSARVVLLTFGLGSLLAAFAAILVSYDLDMAPTMGLNALFMGIVAMVIGGVDSLPGVFLGGLLLGLAQNLAVWFIGSAWQDAVAYLILLIFLLFRPQGFFGRPRRKTTV